MRNPFRYGRELGAGELVNREQEIAAVINAVTESEKLFLIGPRRYGKTSILQAAEEELLRQGAIVLRYNVEAFPTLDLLSRQILTDAANLLSRIGEKTTRQISRFFARLKPEITFNAEDQSWTASIGLKDVSDIPEKEKVILLVEAFNGVERLAAESEPPVGVVLDEFQRIVELGGREAEGQIRAAIQRHRRVGYVFAGSKTRMLTEMTSDPGRPFYRLGERIYVGAVPREQFAREIAQRFRRSGLTVTDEAVEEILNLAEEVPYNVQRLAHACWNALKIGARKSLTAQLVVETHGAIVRQDDPLFNKWWTSFTVNQQRALLSVIREKGRNLFTTRVGKKSGLRSSTMQQAVKALVERDILREEAEGSVTILRFEDPFFKSWIELVLAEGK